MADALGGGAGLARFSKRGVTVGADDLTEGERCMAHQVFRVARGDGRVLPAGEAAEDAMEFRIRCVEDLPFDELLGLLTDDDATGLQVWDACGLMLREIAKPARRYGTVVELGCGVGLIATAYAAFHDGARVVATDGNVECLETTASNAALNAALIPAASEVATAELWFGDASHIAGVRKLLPNGAPDAVLASDVVYCTTPRDVIASLFATARALCPGGPFLLSFIQRDGYGSATDKGAVLDEAAAQGYTATTLSACPIAGTNEINTMYEFLCGTAAGGAHA